MKFLLISILFIVFVSADRDQRSVEDAPILFPNPANDESTKLSNPDPINDETIEHSDSTEDSPPGHVDTECQDYSVKSDASLEHNTPPSTPQDEDSKDLEDITPSIPSHDSEEIGYNTPSTTQQDSKESEQEDLSDAVNVETVQPSDISQNSSLDNVDTGSLDKLNPSRENNLGHNTPSTPQHDEGSSVSDVYNLIDSDDIFDTHHQQAEHLGHLILKRNTYQQSKDYDCNEDTSEEDVKRTEEDKTGEDVESIGDSVPNETKTRSSEDVVRVDVDSEDSKPSRDLIRNYEDSKTSKEPIGKVITTFLRAKEDKYGEKRSTEKSVVENITPEIKYEVQTRRSSRGNETIFIIKVIAPPIIEV